MFKSKRIFSLNEHLCGNVYVKTESPAMSFDIRKYSLSLLDGQLHPTPKGIDISFDQYDKLKEVDGILSLFIPEITTTLPCYM